MVEEARDLRARGDGEAGLVHAAEHQAEPKRAAGVRDPDRLPNPARLRELDRQPMRPLGTADATVRIREDDWYRISTSGTVPDAPDRTMRSYGTLDLLILRTLETLGPMHGFGLARRIEQISESLVHLNQGSIYPALLRLQQKGWITTKQGTSENGRKAKFYSLTTKGRRQLQIEVENWERATALVARFLEGAS